MHFAKALLPAVLVVGLAACREEAVEPPETIRSVKTMVVQEIASAAEREIGGVVSAVQQADLSFPVAGTVQSVTASQGTAVVAGTVLARLDPEPFQLAVSGAQARLAAARADLQEQQLAYTRQRTLYEKDIVARAALDRAESALKTAQAQVDAAQSELANARRKLGQTELQAPFDGRIAQRVVEPFQEVSPGEPAFRIEGGRGLDVDVLVPETLIRRVAYGDAVLIRFPTQAGVEVGGTVAEVGSRSDSGNAFPVTIRMNPDGMPNDADIRPGLTARVVFALATNSGTGGYLIPLSAIALDESGRQAGSSSGSQAPTQADNGRRQASVYLFDAAAGAVRLVPVTVGDLRGNRVEVYSGLSGGDQVVAAGVSFLYDGMPAKRWTPDI
jgi:RND family efflux transporter MFP subunit